MKPLVLSPRHVVVPLVVLLALAAAAASPSARASSATASTAAAEPGAASVPAQRTRMKTCNAEAHDKHGPERRAFMKQCLSKKGAAASAAG